jgi:hypothetical protein
MTKEDDDLDFDIWDRLGINCGGYNSAVDQQILDVAKIIVEARKTARSGCVYTDDIAAQLGFSNEHIELIQYILASVRYKSQPHLKDQPFTYGVSPRGLFVDDMECAERFLAEFERHMSQWGE